MQSSVGIIGVQVINIPPSTIIHGQLVNLILLNTVAIATRAQLRCRRRSVAWLQLTSRSWAGLYTITLYTNDTFGDYCNAQFRQVTLLYSDLIGQVSL